jgi:hypothetical protein
LHKLQTISPNEYTFRVDVLRKDSNIRGVELTWRNKPTASQVHLHLMTLLLSVYPFLEGDSNPNDGCSILPDIRDVFRTGLSSRLSESKRQHRKVPSGRDRIMFNRSHPSNAMALGNQRQQLAHYIGISRCRSFRHHNQYVYSPTLH